MKEENPTNLAGSEAQKLSKKSDPPPPPIFFPSTIKPFASMTFSPGQVSTSLALVNNGYLQRLNCSNFYLSLFQVCKFLFQSSSTVSYKLQLTEGCQLLVAYFCGKGVGKMRYYFALLPIGQTLFNHQLMFRDLWLPLNQKIHKQK